MAESITSANTTLEDHYLFFYALIDYARANDFEGIEITRPSSDILILTK
jgi:hypothetical protein